MLPDAPKDPALNREFRQFLKGECLRKRKYLEALDRCKHDFDWFSDSWVWQYNPNLVNKVGPFILRARQSQIIKSTNKRLFPEIQTNLRLDVIWEKSREEGGSWMALDDFVHRSLFWPRERFICVSHTADAVDKSGDPDSLFWKIDFINEHLPEWMEPPQGDDRIKMRILYPRTKSTVTGAACSPTTTVGGRGVVLLDELGKQKWANEIIAQTADVGPRLMVSTHYGAGTAFYQQTVRPDVFKEVLHWTDNPEKNPGMYRYDEDTNQIVILDKTYSFPDKYPYVMAAIPVGGPFKHIRSLWYDAECLRRQSPRDVAQHLDINPEGSGHQYFDGPTIQYLVREFSDDPKWEGDVQVDRDTGELKSLVKVEGGPLKFWFYPENDRRVQPGKYGMGGDIAAGTGATPSCLSIGDSALGMKVAQYQNANISPEKFATIAFAIGRLFAGPDGREAYFAWEMAGAVGAAFGKALMALGYRNVYYRETPMKFAGVRDQTETPGWYPKAEARGSLLSAYRTALGLKQFVNPSKDALEDCLKFVYTIGDDVRHSGEIETDDPSAARFNHGDQVMADALCCMAMEKLGTRREIKEKAKEPPAGGWEWRRERGEALDREREMAWD